MKRLRGIVPAFLAGLLPVLPLHAFVPRYAAAQPTNTTFGVQGCAFGVRRSFDPAGRLSGTRLATGVCEDHAFPVKRGAESRKRGRPRPQQRVLRFSGFIHRFAQIFCFARRGGRDERLLVHGQADACPSRRSASPDTAHRNLDRPFTELGQLKKQGNAFTLKIASHCVVAIKEQV